MNRRMFMTALAAVPGFAFLGVEPEKDNPKNLPVLVLKNKKFGTPKLANKFLREIAGSLKINNVDIRSIDSYSRADVTSSCRVWVNEDDWMEEGIGMDGKKVMLFCGECELTIAFCRHFDHVFSTVRINHIKGVSKHVIVPTSGRNVFSVADSTYYAPSISEKILEKVDAKAFAEFMRQA